jgi:hypothetical protein
MYILLAIALLVFLGYWWGSSAAKNELDKFKAERAQFLANLVWLEGNYKDPKEKAVVQQLLSQFGIAASGSASHAPPAAQPVAPPQVLAPAVAPQPVQRAANPIDNVTILLYLGAFLFTSAIGLFIAFGGLGGAAKTFLVALVVAVFYGGGVMICQQSAKLKPAGLTFMAIGMVLLPFVGLAAHNFLFDGQSGSAVWLVTSLVAAALYWHALTTTKFGFVSYFLLASVLSMFEAGVAITELPVYYFAWVMALVGMVFLLVARKTKVMPELQEPLTLASGVAVPSALLFSLVFAANNGLGQTALSFGLAAGYYALAALLSDKSTERSVLATIAATMGYIGLALGVWNQSESGSTLSLALSFVSLLQTVAMYILFAPHGRGVHKSMSTGLAGVVTVAMLAATLLRAGNAPLLLVTMGVFLAIQLALYMITSDVANIVLAVAIWLIAPLIIALYLSRPAMTAQALCGLYMLATAGLFSSRIVVDPHKVLKIICQVGYLLGLSMVFLTILGAGAGPIALVGLLLAVTAAALSYYEKFTWLFGIAAALLFVAGTAFATLMEGYDNGVTIPAVSIVLSLALYMGAMLGIEPTRAKILRYSALIGLTYGAFATVFTASVHLPMIINLATLGALAWYESSVQKSRSGMEWSGAICMAAFQWFLIFYGVEQFQIYSHLWAALLGLYAYLRYTVNNHSAEQGFTAAALCTLSIPLALQALGDQGQYYGWLLIMEHVGLALIGTLINRPFIIKWGLTVSILAVLYQLRELTFVVLGLVGLGVIGLAVYLLNKYDSQKTPPTHTGSA